MIVRRIGGLGLLATAVAFGGSGCGGGSSSPTAPPQATPTPAPAPTPTPTPTPSPDPGPTASSCPLGKGSVRATCSRTNPTFLPDVNDAIEKLVAESPDLFDKSDTNGIGGYRVLDAERYAAGVVENLAEQGFCAQADDFLQLKNTNDLSERYDILLSTGHIRRGDGSYRETCTPAAFPVDASDHVESVRVAFYGIRCANGKTPPGNGEGKLPVGCDGQVTATPKDADGEDVPAVVHGPDIRWDLQEGDQNVEVEDVADQAFNKVVSGVEVGHFILCAEVLGVEGCLFGEVIP
jgi:hypothetical protein